MTLIASVATYGQPGWAGCHVRSVVSSRPARHFRVPVLLQAGREASRLHAARLVLSRTECRSFRSVKSLSCDLVTSAPVAVF